MNPFGRLASCFIFLAATIAVAQAPGDFRNLGQVDDVELARMLHAKNLEGIALGQLARERAGSERVRAYADRLVRDHAMANARLARWAEDNGVTLAEPAARVPGSPSHTTRARSQEARLTDVPADSFDTAFLDAMTEGRRELGESLSRARIGISDRRLKAFVRDLIPIVEQHRELAGNLRQDQTAAAPGRETEGGR